MQNKCACCEKSIPRQGHRICPECKHAFAGNGWDGIDSHWKNKHAAIMSYDSFWKSLCEAHRGNGGGNIQYKQKYFEFIKKHGVGRNDVAASSPDSYLSYLKSVSKIIRQDITLERLNSEEDITRIRPLIEGERKPSTIQKYVSAMRLYVDMTKTIEDKAGGKCLPIKYFVEQYWPEETRDLDDLYLWFHDKKLKKDAELKDGDRVLFYEVAKHPEKDVVGAKALFASGTLTSERYCIPVEKQISGGKRWVFGRKVETDFAVTPQKGIPLAEAKKVLGISGWPQQGFALKKEQFDLLEKQLIARLEQSNIDKGQEHRQKPGEREFSAKLPKKIETLGSLGDAAERIARLEKSHNAHRAILNKLANILATNGFATMDNSQVDLFAEQKGVQWIFEVKSTHEGNILSQARHGISQLYEYRYHYRNSSPKVNLCLVLQCPPDGDLSWLVDYIRHDRDIHICWSVPNGFASINDTDLKFLRTK